MHILPTLKFCYQRENVTLGMKRLHFAYFFPNNNFACKEERFCLDCVNAQARLSMSAKYIEMSCAC